MNQISTPTSGSNQEIMEELSSNDLDMTIYRMIGDLASKLLVI